MYNTPYETVGEQGTSIMKICLVGVSCVGKTTIGRRLAERLVQDHETYCVMGSSSSQL